jgi:hypothetical protein
VDIAVPKQFVGMEHGIELKSNVYIYQKIIFVLYIIKLNMIKLVLQWEKVVVLH